MATSPEAVMLNSKELEELLTKLQDSLTKATNKNNALLESLETVEARAMDSSNGELSLLRNLRARLSATHLPNSELRKSLPVFAELFKKQFKDLAATLKTYKELNIKLEQDSKDVEEQLKHLDMEEEKFEKERAEWRRDIEQAQKEITDQNDRLTFLSQQLSGKKTALEAETNELANRRIAFEEEKLIRETLTTQTQASEGEAETLRMKLRDQTLSNIHLESSLLRTEVSLHQKEEEIIKYEEKVWRLQHEIQQLRMTSSKAVKQFEKRTKEANIKLSEMNSELSKAQEHAHKFQDLLTTERRKQKALKHALDQSFHDRANKDELNPSAQKAYLETLSETLKSTKPLHATRVEDIVRKSESVLVENSNLKADIRKLRIENSDLLRRVRFADTNAHYMRNQVLTSLQDRAELIKKLYDAEVKLKQVRGTFDLQAKDYVAQKKKEAAQHRKAQLKEIKPISTLGANERTWNIGPAKTTSLSRTNIQVTKW